MLLYYSLLGNTPSMKGKKHTITVKVPTYKDWCGVLYHSFIMLDLPLLTDAFLSVIAPEMLKKEQPCIPWLSQRSQEAYQ